MPVSISNLPNTPRIRRAFFAAAKNAILNSRYELSVAFVSSREIRQLNRDYRRTDAPTDILAFPLSTESGELLLCIPAAKRRTRLFGLTLEKYLRFLVIHGLLHLKGMTHGSRMEKQEKKFRKRFKI